jgi:hypothetical protein
MTIEQKPSEPNQNTQDDVTTNPNQPPADADEDDWLDTSKACDRNDPECEACQ